MSNLFWGLLLVLGGTELIVRTIFGVSIPFLKIFLGLFLIYLGFSFLTDIGSNKRRKTFRFRDQYVIEQHAQYDYRTILGNATIDLSQVQLTSDKSITVETILGSTDLIINPHIPTTITIDTHCANVEWPDKANQPRETAFGKYTYKTDSASQQPHLTIYAKVTLGNLKIKNS